MNKPMSKMEAIQKLTEGLVACREAGLWVSPAMGTPTVTAIDALVGSDLRVVVLKDTPVDTIVPGKKRPGSFWRSIKRASTLPGWHPFSDAPDAELSINYGKFVGECSKDGAPLKAKMSTSI